MLKIEDAVMAVAGVGRIFRTAATGDRLAAVKQMLVAVHVQDLGLTIGLFLPAQSEVSA